MANLTMTKTAVRKSNTGQGVANPAFIWFGVFLFWPLLGLVWQFKSFSFGVQVMDATTTGPLLGLLCLTTITDLLQNKIYNWATYTSFFWAIIVNALATTLQAPEEFFISYGVVGLASCLLGAASCFGLMFVAYHLSRFQGAGDVKLATALGAWLGVQNGIMAILYTYILAGVILSCWFMIRFGPWPLIRYFSRSFLVWLLPSFFIGPDPVHLPELKRPVPMGAFFAFGTVLVLCRVFKP